MKSRGFTAFILFTFALVLGFEAFAFTRSEDELMRSEIQEAKARARDFRAQQERTAEADREREVAAVEIKAERLKSEEEAERLRVRYIEVRNSVPDRETDSVRLEKLFDAQKAREDEQMEANRASYLRKRAAVRKTIETEAYIDGNEEFGLK